MTTTTNRPKTAEQILQQHLNHYLLDSQTEAEARLIRAVIESAREGYVLARKVQNPYLHNRHYRALYRSMNGAEWKRRTVTSWCEATVRDRRFTEAEREFALKVLYRLDDALAVA